MPIRGGGADSGRPSAHAWANGRDTLRSHLREMHNTTTRSPAHVAVAMGKRVYHR
jgi:hypothetical protein